VINFHKLYNEVIYVEESNQFLCPVYKNREKNIKVGQKDKNKLNLFVNTFILMIGEAVLKYYEEENI